ncbi:hypothetical protein GY21_01600 [Cryobacterium roopkundense]|nr:hypothetical protein GY21_01600 [Cryobacterium roopkundense]
MCLLEAMSAKLPIVAGVRSGGVPWTLFEGEAGILVDVSAVDALSKGILQTLTRPEDAAARADRAVTLMGARYSPEIIAQQYLGEYARITQTAAADSRPSQSTVAG